MFGPRRPSLMRALGMTFGLKQRLVHSLGIKMPRGLGWLRSPRRAAYNAVYSRTSFSLAELLLGKTPQPRKGEDYDRPEEQ